MCGQFVRMDPCELRPCWRVGDGWMFKTQSTGSLLEISLTILNDMMWSSVVMWNYQYVDKLKDIIISLKPNTQITAYNRQMICG